MTEQIRGANGKWIRSPENAQRDAHAMELRSKGWTYRRIAAELGMDVHDAHDAVQQGYKDITAEAAETMRTIEADRLDALYAAAIEVLERRHITVSNGQIIRETKDGPPLEDDAPILAAINAAVKISESRRKLFGLDAAAKVDMSGGVTYEIVGVDMDQLR